MAGRPTARRRGTLHRIHARLLLAFVTVCRNEGLSRTFGCWDSLLYFGLECRQTRSAETATAPRRAGLALVSQT